MIDTPNSENPSYERIMLTAVFACGHEGIIPVFRVYAEEYKTRRIGSEKLCKNCQAAKDSREEARAWK